MASPTAPAPEPAPVELTLLQRLNPFSKAKKARPAPEAELLPIPLETYIAQAGNVDKTPVTPFSWKYLRDLMYSSDVLALIVRTKTNETFRSGLDVTERYMSKCTKCGREYEEEKLLCQFDNAEVILPDYAQWKSLNAFLSQTTRFGTALLTVMREVDTDLHIGDNGWLFLERAYSFSGDGAVVGDEVRGVLRFDPNMMRLIMSRYGMGTTETGTYVYFCPEHRTTFSEFGEKGTYHCVQCNKILFPAWYMSLTKAERLYYSPAEIYHIKLYSNAQGYGVSPIMSCHMKVNALLRMDKFVLQAYELQRAPQELLIIRGKRDSIHRAWEWLMQKSRENPNMVYPLVLEGDEQSKSRVVEHETFALKPIEWSWTEMRQEYRNVIGAVFGVQPIFSSGAQMQAGGLANEGLQMAVTTLAIKQEQHVWNMFLDFLSVQLGATDYVFKLNPNEQEDELRDLDVEAKRIGIAQTMQQFGYEVEAHEDSKGRLEFTYKEGTGVEEMPEEEQAGFGEETIVEGAPKKAKKPKKEEKDDKDEDKEVDKKLPPKPRPEMSMTERRAQNRREARRAMANPGNFGDAAAVANNPLDDKEKANYTSKPAKKIKRNPRGDEDADMSNVSPTANFNILDT